MAAPVCRSSVPPPEWVHPVKLDTLQELTGSRNGQAADFKRKCSAALGSLTKIGFLTGYSVEGDTVTVQRSLRALPQA